MKPSINEHIALAAKCSHIRAALGHLTTSFKASHPVSRAAWRLAEGPLLKLRCALDSAFYYLPSASGLPSPYFRASEVEFRDVPPIVAAARACEIAGEIIPTIKAIVPSRAFLALRIQHRLREIALALETNKKAAHSREEV